ncbi:hypothetical protein ACFVR2_22865 [Gottfriedia sp. NPDC057991]|uniref:hypothetical protein n=1 Tax=Gottfriedia sp. NPDC057991 TaxID=3346298 RepID=UPI0036DA7FF3
MKVHKDTSNASFMGMRFEDESMSASSKSIFNIKANEQFTPTLEILNSFDTKQKYRILFLFDYQQPVVFSVDGKEHTYIDLNINSNSKEKIDIIFPKLSIGQHDMTTIMIRDPDRVLKKPNFKMGALNAVVTKKNIIVSTNKINPPQFINVEPEPNTANYGNNIILNNGPSIDLKKPLSLINNKVTDNIWGSFEKEIETSKYAVITLNFDQIKSVTKFISTNSSKGVIKLPIEVPKGNQVPSKFVVIGIKNPFTTDNRPPLLSNIISIVDN